MAMDQAMRYRFRSMKSAAWLCITLMLTACQLAGQAPLVPRIINIQSVPLAEAPTCTNSFVPHILDHTTGISDSPIVQMFESNGAGVAVNDLNNDGNLDIVLANLDGQNSIFWNQGGFQFQKEAMIHGDSRAVTIVDVDGDGWQDIVFTRRLDRPTYWRNLGAGAAHNRFEITMLPGVTVPAYTMAWGDLDQSGTLDLVASSYDAALLQGQIATNSSAASGGMGTYVYTHVDQRFVARKLIDNAQTLAIGLPDLNNDGKLDIMVGNDFDTLDYTWLNTSSGWQVAEPFSRMTRNTMSIAIADINNSGRRAIFTADMKPYDQQVSTLAAWLPMMQIMPPPPPRADPQINENVLQVQAANGQFANQAYERGVDASGWSWSSQFGDLNNDGFLDLYVVNGMIGKGLFDQLPNHELVEQNQVFRNSGNGQFVSSLEWGLGRREGGRGMTIADLNTDGKLDIVINNLLAPAIVLENRLCDGAGLEVDLRMPAGKNPYAIGARLVLHTSAGTYYRDIQTSSGYLSGVPSRVHFGFPSDTELEYLEVHWPDGSIVQTKPLVANRLITITQADLTQADRKGLP
jgi:enediyne biosynthesis protein E4